MAMTLNERIAELTAKVEEMKAANQDELEALRIKYLSKKGEISELFNEFRAVSKEEKAARITPSSAQILQVL